VGGTLIGEYDEGDDDRGPRNVLVVTLAKTGEFFLERLAKAFGLSSHYVWQLRRQEERDGLRGVIGPRQGKVTKVTPEIRAAWFAMFDEGRTAKDVDRAQPKKDRRVYSTVWQAWNQWRRERAEGSSARTSASARATPASATPVDSAENQMPLWATNDATDEAASEPAPEESDPIIPMTAQPVRGGKHVQHVGCWLLLALVGELGLYEEAQTAFVGRHPDGLRIALDAVICALAIRQQVVEGVRRLATQSGATLLRAERVPSASGIRKLLHRLLEQTEGGVALERQMAERLLGVAKHSEGAAVFYVDNQYPGTWPMRRDEGSPSRAAIFYRHRSGRPYRLLRNERRSLRGRHAGSRTVVSPECFQNVSRTRRFIFRLDLVYRPVVEMLSWPR
jgi:hypothetical protein